MPAVITDLCLRDGACVTVCPVDCIVPGDPHSQWVHYYIDPEVCIMCNACIPECPHGAIYPLDEVPSRFIAHRTEKINQPVGTVGCTEIFESVDHNGKPIRLLATRTLAQGEVVDLTSAVVENARFFEEGPGYETT